MPLFFSLEKSRRINIRIGLIICDGVHPERVELTSPMEYTTSRVDAPQVRRSCENALEIFTQAFLHRPQPNTRCLKSGHSWPLVVILTPETAGTVGI